MPDRRGQHPLERQDRVRRAAGEQGAGPLLVESGRAEAGRRAQAVQTEAGHEQRVIRDPDHRTQKVLEQAVRMF